MTETAPPGTGGRMSVLMLLLAVAVALSPVLAEFVAYLRGIDGNFAILIAPALLCLVVWLRPSTQPIRARHAAVLIGLAVALQFAGILLASATIARLAVPLAALGMAALAGRPSAGSVALLFWLIPIPISLLSVSTPWLESQIAAAATSVVAAVGVSIEASGPLVRIGAASLELQANNNGFWLAFVFAELAWYVGLVRRLSNRRRILSTLVAALFGVPGQFLATLMALVLLSLGLESLARDWLDWMLSYSVSLIVVLATWPRRSTVAG